MMPEDTDDSLWSKVRYFADRHVRQYTLGLCLVAIPVALLLLVPSILAVTATPITTPVVLKTALSLTFLDKSEKVIGRQGPLPGRYLRLGQMPRYLPEAFIAMEDRRFYSHHGVDFLGLTRAAYADLRARRVVAGGSTISQQTAKLLFTDGSRTFRRKLNELFNTAALEKSFGKDQILELYLNRIYLGEGTFGVDTAARNYFGVPASNLNLYQAAMLAGLTRAPTVYSPRRSLALAQKRAVMVLAEMVGTGAISPAQAQEAQAHPAGIIPAYHNDRGYVLDAAAGEVQKLVTETGVTARSLIVHTTIDAGLQAEAEDVVRRTAIRLGPKLGFSQAALVLMTPDGGISSMVGGVSYANSVFNRVTQAHRQPGSAFKPFVYLAALEHGVSPWDWREDQPVDIAGYQPANYQDASYGRLRVIDALMRSVNTVSVRLAQEVGLGNVSSAAKRLGIESPLHDNASLALGTDEVTPLELTAAYAAFANSGRTAVPHLITRIDDTEGKILYQKQAAPQKPVVNDNTLRDMLAMLCGVIESGTGTAARLPGRDAGGKTGTTQDYRDAWFVGFTASHVAGVWVGNDNNSPMRKVTGGTVPAQIWKAVMLTAEAHTPAVGLERSREPATEPEEAVVTAYSDDPMQGSTIVDTGANRAPETENAPPAPVTAGLPVVIPQMRAQTRPVALANTQPMPVPTAAPAPEGGLAGGFPYQASQTDPRLWGNTAVAAPAMSPTRDALSDPPSPSVGQETAEAEAQARRQREAEYRRVLRETTRPPLDEDASPAPHEGEIRGTSTKEGLPFPGPRARADRPGWEVPGN